MRRQESYRGKTEGARYGRRERGDDFGVIFHGLFIKNDLKDVSHGPIRGRN